MTTAVASPYDADVLLFRMDRGGNEINQIYLRNLKDGSERLLTDGKSPHGMPVWAHDGKRIAFSGNGRDGASYDIYVADTTTSTAPQLVIAGGSDALQCAGLVARRQETSAAALRLDHRELPGAGRPGHRRAHSGRTGRRPEGTDVDQPGAVRARWPRHLRPDGSWW